MEWYLWAEKALILGVIGLLFWSNRNFTKAQTELLIEAVKRLNQHDIDIAVIKTKIGDN